MIKLARNLFLHEPDPKYMDYVERGLFNQIAGSRQDTNTNSNPNVTYFQPLTPGNRRSYGNTGTCCGGTGMENHTKYQESVYFQLGRRHRAVGEPVRADDAHLGRARASRSCRRRTSRASSRRS